MSRIGSEISAIPFSAKGPEVGSRGGGLRLRSVAPQSDETLNLKPVAARLGVHYMTAYRYVRQGHLAAHRVGNGWRVEPVALEAFQAGRANPDPADESGNLGDQVDWCERITAALLANDEVTAWDLIDRALAAGHDPAYCFLDMIAAALTEIGARSEQGEVGPSAWPSAIVMAERLVARLGARFRRPGRRRGTVVLGAPEGEQHQIPISILADLVRLEGFEVIELGADAAPAAFAHAAETAAYLHVVGIGVTTVQQLDAAAAVIAAVRSVVPRVPIVVGGQAVRNEDVARVLDADAWAPDGRRAVSTIIRLSGRDRARDVDNVEVGRQQ